MGRPDEAKEQMKLAYELDSLSPFRGMILGWALHPGASL